ncbi:hypothetical protein QCA50_019172 [Cerrena zonata]|uniref:DNA mismatch repair protein PMS1 n=1 Tax=Cerrena zonata TaxID=2478898 RepID=A0AAW0FMB9_9APHY
MSSSIKAIDAVSVHRISSGQVVTDLPTAVKELIENSLDAGATNIDIRFKDYGTESIEVSDNGSGIAPEDYDAIALKHHTSKLETFEDLSSVSTFGFRGEALSSLCALCNSVTVTTATTSTSPMGTILELDRGGRVVSRSGKVARQRGTTVLISKLFKNLPVRRKELEKNAKREYGKALNLLTAYALVPCTNENRGVRMVCTNLVGGRKTGAIRTDGSPSVRASVSALWGPKALENIVDLDLTFEVETDKSVTRRQALIGSTTSPSQTVHVRGLVSKFTVGGGRSGTDRQFFYVNGRPCTPTKVQKAFNEIYRTFNANQSPFIVADFIIPKDCLDINVSPDKRTIFIHSEGNLIQSLRTSLEETFSPSRSTFNVNPTQPPQQTGVNKRTKSIETPLFLDDPDEPSGVDGSDRSAFGEAGPLLEPSVSSSPPPSSLGRSMDMEEDVPFAQGSPEEPNDDRHEIDAPTSSPVTEAQTMSPDNSHATESIANDLEMDFAPEGPDTDVPASRRERSCDEATAVRGAHNDVAPIASPVVDTGKSRAAVRPVQMVLSTANASWNLRRAAADSSDRPAKRHKPDQLQPADGRKVALTGSAGLRKQLLGFARAGSQIVSGKDWADSDEGDDQETMMEIDELQSDADEAESGDGSAREALDKNKAAAHQSCLPSSIDITVEAEGVQKQIEPDTPTSRQGRVGRLEETVELHQQNSQAKLQNVPSRPPEIVRTTKGNDISINLDLTELSTSWKELHTYLTSSTFTTNSEDSQRRDDLSRDAGIQTDDDKAQEALSRIIDKSDFLAMDIIGQFNRGFIIARRRKQDSSTELVMDDLFIIDQHAADEKYNFEQLQETTRIESQKLIRPQPIELAASDELLAIDNVEVLRQNGFEIEVNETAAEECDHRLRLMAKPVSKTTEFDMKDLEELIHLMHDQPQGRMVRCSKARAMFASRACRKSVMIGHPLQLPQLTSIIRHMGTMSQPWNCPHGRPTMRHLTDLLPVNGDPGTSQPDRRRIVDFHILDRYIE